MALLINKEKILTGGISVKSIYGRLSYQINEQNNQATVFINFYASKDAYINKLGRLPLNHEPNYFVNIDPKEIDLINVIHKEIIKQLTDENAEIIPVKSKVIVYDYDEDGGVKTVDGNPVIIYNVGDQLKDENGELIFETVYLKKAFCKLENISIVDL